MEYWRINTDHGARADLRTCDVWYRFGMAFTGDFVGERSNHDKVFRKLLPGDGVFMHHSSLGVVGYGIVAEEWDRKTYEGQERLLYRKELYEYRIAVDWAGNCDCREEALPISGRLPHMGTYTHVNTKKWDVQGILQDLRNRALWRGRCADSVKTILPGETDNMKTDEIHRILSCIGNPVKFKYPGNEGDKCGVLKDRVVVESTNDLGTVPYWDVVDLIEFDSEREPEWIRIGYYRKPKSKLNWGSQTTITEPISIWKRILVNAVREKKWFRDLLQDVLRESKE